MGTAIKYLLPFVTSLIPAVQNGVKTKEIINQSIKDFTEKSGSIISVMKLNTGTLRTLTEFADKIDY